MMKILLLVLVFAAAAGAGVYLLDDSGYVLINIGDYIIETSVVTLVVVAVLGGLLLLLSLRALRGSLRAPSTIRRSLLPYSGRMRLLPNGVVRMSSTDCLR